MLSSPIRRNTFPRPNANSLIRTQLPRERVARVDSVHAALCLRAHGCRIEMRHIFGSPSVSRRRRRGIPGSSIKGDHFLLLIARRRHVLCPAALVELGIPVVAPVKGRAESCRVLLVTDVVLMLSACGRMARLRVRVSTMGIVWPRRPNRVETTLRLFRDERRMALSVWILSVACVGWRNRRRIRLTPLVPKSIRRAIA